MNLGLVQYNPLWENKEENKQKILRLLDKNLDEVSLLIFPEMTLTGFTMKSSQFAEELKGKSFLFFSELSKKKNVHCIAGIIEKENGNFFNTLIHINVKGELVNKYQKIHPFSYAEEDKNYSKGKKVQTTTIDSWKIGLSICYDLRFPELFRFYGKEKVDLIINIANWPIARIEHWRTLLKARAIENQCFMIGVNRVGKDPTLDYSGYSSVYDPMGAEIISSSIEEKIITAYIDNELVTSTRKKLPFLNDISLI
ncbi:MAG: carbon-nitrogen family hydrolase [Ignavibacteriaceae bacterium]